MRQTYWAKVWRILHQLDPQRPLDRVPTQRFREAVMCLLEASVYEPNTAMSATLFAIEEKLPLIDVPTLFMCSDTDWNLPHHESLVAAVPSAVSRRLPGVNPIHDLHEDRAADYGRLLHDFFAPLR
jgi:pimeloyl-ACP methyl ester carboxylesterase